MAKSPGSSIAWCKSSLTRIAFTTHMGQWILINFDKSFLWYSDHSINCLAMQWCSLCINFDNSSINLYFDNLPLASFAWNTMNNQSRLMQIIWVISILIFFLNRIIWIKKQHMFTLISRSTSICVNSATSASIYGLIYTQDDRLKPCLKLIRRQNR